MGTPYYRGYLIETQERAVGIPLYDFVVKTSIIQIARQAPLNFVSLSSGKLDNSHDPNLQIKDRTAEFVDYDGHDVQVAW